MTRHYLRIGLPSHASICVHLDELVAERLARGKIDSTRPVSSLATSSALFRRNQDILPDGIASGIPGRRQGNGICSIPRSELRNRAREFDGLAILSGHFIAKGHSDCGNSVAATCYCRCSDRGWCAWCRTRASTKTTTSQFGGWVQNPRSTGIDTDSNVPIRVCSVGCAWQGISDGLTSCKATRRRRKCEWTTSRWAFVGEYTYDLRSCCALPHDDSRGIRVDGISFVCKMTRILLDCLLSNHVDRSDEWI